MKLYKYIGFHTDYWSKPYFEKMMFFSHPPQLRSVNDPDEFNHNWDSDNWVFQTSSELFRSNYDKIFQNARILCMSKELSEENWKSFCPMGGVCYEFEFDEKVKSKSVNSDHVIYSDKKVLNVPEFIIEECADDKIKKILTMKEKPTQNRFELLAWLGGQNSREIIQRHVYSELVLKKLNKFRSEAEYRFIHPIVHPNGGVLSVTFDDNRISFANLGLQLNRIHTTSLETLHQTIPSPNVDISLIELRDEP